MPSMFVTLEVSKLSGWLNTDAYCRESKGGHAVGARYTGQQSGGGGRPRRKQRAGKRSRLQILGRAQGEERT